MIKKIKTILIFILLIIILFNLFIFSETVMESVTFGFDIWKSNLFPSIFPFLIISNLFINYGITDVISELTKPFISNIFNINDSSNYLFILSLFSGFPTSSKLIYDSYKKDEISKQDADYLLNICIFSNPLFIIGTIGILLLNNKKLGIIILLIHYLSNFITAYIFKSKEKKISKINIRKSFTKMKYKINNSDKLGKVIKEAVINSINTLLLLLGIIIIFLIITNIFMNSINNNLITIYLSGILEITNGIKNISNLNISLIIKLSMIISLLSFGGISVHMQILSILENYDFNYLKFIFIRIFTAFISIILIILYSYTIHLT